MEIINGAANGEKMELGTVFLHADICPLTGGHRCNFQMLCSHGCLNAARFWFAGLRFHLQTSLRTAQVKQDPCGAFWPCRTGLSDLGRGAESTPSSLQAAPGQGWCSEGRQQAGGKQTGTLWGSAKAKVKFCWVGFGWEMPPGSSSAKEEPWRSQQRGRRTRFSAAPLWWWRLALCWAGTVSALGPPKMQWQQKDRLEGVVEGCWGALGTSTRHMSRGSGFLLPGEAQRWISLQSGPAWSAIMEKMGQGSAKRISLRMDGCNKLQLKNYTLTNGKNRSPLGRLITGMDCPTPSVERFKIW